MKKINEKGITICPATGLKTTIEHCKSSGVGMGCQNLKAGNICDFEEDKY